MKVHIATLVGDLGTIYLNASDLEAALRKAGWYEAADFVEKLRLEAK